MSEGPFPPPRAIRPGARLAIVAPSGPFDRDAFARGLERLRARYDVRLDEGIYARDGYLAGDDARRVAELHRAIDDPSIDAIVCARGGYGATRLLDALDVERVRAANKLLVGFSDVSALHALWARAGVRSLHASMVAGLGTMSDVLAARWLGVLETQLPPDLACEPLTRGTSTGVLVGGNLAVLCAMLGTPHALPIDGRVLFLEDVGERPYRVDRMLTQLRQAGWLQRARAIVLGAFTDGRPGPDGTTLESVLRERLSDAPIPIVLGVPAGHLDDNLELPFGRTVIVDADRGLVRFGA